MATTTPRLDGDGMTDTTETTTTDVTALADTYIAMWNEEDAAARRTLIEEAWATDGSYRDPLLSADGHAALSEMVQTVHAHYPGQRFTRTTAVDEHNGFARFGWSLGPEEGPATVTGLDVAELTPEGKLRHITGFFGDLA
jgi:hypothetical protein